MMTIVGTRPEIIRLSCVIKKLDEYCEHTLIHTGQNYDYELNKGIRKPKHFLNAIGRAPITTIGNEDLLVLSYLKYKI